MYKFLKNLSCLLCLIIVFGGCRKKAFDEYYGRPASLAPPIYQVLQSRGNFTNLLAVIDKSGYTATLSSGGYWTMFAPNDAAFQKYFTANNTSLDKIDSVTAGKIVRYCLVYNAFQTNHIADYQSPTGWVSNTAFKRRTAYYDGFLKGTTPAGANGVYVSDNRDFGTYLYGDNNNKYIPYFYSTFMTQAGLTATDYNYFYPASTYNGFNVAGAAVVNKDIVAENGVIDEIDQVILPLPSVEQKMLANSQYSLFQSIYDQFLESYVVDANYTRQYNTLTGKTDQVYVKQYSASLNYAPGNESFLKLTDNDSQTNGYTLFAPTNAALTPYLGGTGVAGSILEYYGSLTSLPNTVIVDLMNAHMFATSVWPSKFATTSNGSGEPARFDSRPVASGGNVVESTLGSNGIFYGVNQVQKANVFSTVYARAYLDPAYSIMLRLINLYIKPALTSPGLQYTVFMLPDATLQALGYNYDSPSSSFTQTTNGVTVSGGTPQAALQRILYMQIIPTSNGELNDLSGDGIAEGYGGEYIRWHQNTVASAGSVELNKVVSVTGSRTYSNGKIYYLNNTILDIPTKTVANDIAANAGTAAAPGPYYDFYTYLINSGAYNAGATEILGLQLGTNVTVFIPTRAAMQQAVLDGYLPGTYTTNPVTGVKTFVSFTYNPTVSTDKDLVSRFIYYHIINGTTIAPDGKKGVQGTSWPTFLKSSTGNALTVVTFNPPGTFPTALQIEDSQARFISLTAPVLNPLTLPGQTSSYLGYHALLHQISGYLRYTYN